VGKISKTDRILAVWHLLRHCREVSFKEVTDQMPVSKKTVYRDIRLLKMIGCDINFSREQKAFVMSGERVAPQFPENKTQRRYMEKILRLITLMAETGGDDLVAWYRERFPYLSSRTMQRDFRILNGIGYYIEYERTGDNPSRPAGKYYREWPEGSYSLNLFS